MFLFEKNNISYSIHLYQKLFNSQLSLHKNNSFYNKCHNLNLNRIIKQFYITFLYDLCDYGSDDNPQIVCELDVEILSLLSKRIHFNYEIIKLKYINDQIFYNNLFKLNNDSEIIYHLSNFIKEPSYLEKIYDYSVYYSLNPTLIQSLYKFNILPTSIEIQFSFLDNLLNKTV